MKLKYAFCEELENKKDVSYEVFIYNSYIFACPAFMGAK